MKKAWQWIDGYKTNISAALFVAWEGFQLIFPDLINENWEKWITDIIAIVAGVGLTHKGIKTLKKK